MLPLRPAGREPDYYGSVSYQEQLPREDKCQSRSLWCVLVKVKLLSWAVCFRLAIQLVRASCSLSRACSFIID